MCLKIGRGNKIAENVKIDENVIIGNYNFIGNNVIISSFKGEKSVDIHIGDCNFIHDNTRILIGSEGLSIGDWNVFHNSILLMGDKKMEIGHNCWFGQNTIIDSTGGLFIGNGVRVGMYSQIWTHVGSGELIEGCTLFSTRPTYIEDEVWLVGSCIVGSGLRLGYRSVCLIGSNLTKNTEPLKVYAGVPAKSLDKLNFWRAVTLNEKFEMMNKWVKQFIEQMDEEIIYSYDPKDNIIKIHNNESNEHLIIGVNMDINSFDKNTTYFDLKNKTYTKRLTDLERKFYKYIFDHKSRFIPSS